MTIAPPVHTTRIDARLRQGAIVYGVGLALHTADHLRRGAEVLTRDVKMSGAISTALGLVTLWLILVRRERAAWTAAIVGLSTAIGVSIVHLLPKWSSFSDAFPGASGTGVTALSWTVVLVEIVGALLLGIAGVTALLRREPSR